MATGGGHGWASPGSHYDRIEEPSRKYDIIKSFFDRLVKETGGRERKLVDKLREKGAITPQQRENVVKTLRQQHLATDYAPSLLFEIILKSVQNDDINFDRLLLAFRELGLGDLADELQSALSTPTHLPDEQEMEHNDAHINDGPLTDQPNDTSSEKMREEMSLFDSGAPQSFTLPDSSSASSSDESHMFVHHGQQELVINQPRLDVATPDQQFTPPMQESHSEEETLVSGSANEDHSDTDMPMVQPDNLDTSLQSHPQLQEPADIDEIEAQQMPIQAHNEQSNALLLVPNTSSNYTSIVEEVSGTSSNEELFDHLAHRLIQMRLEIQNKERELQEMQQNSELHQRCRNLEEKVRKMEEEVKMQKIRTDKVSSDKDKEIDSWKKKCEEKELEIQELRATIARQQDEKDALTKTHIAEIEKLQEQKEENAQKVSDYETKVAALNIALREATQKKDEAEEQLKLAGFKMHEAVAERQKVENELLRTVIVKGEELSQLKDAKYKLELEIRDLRQKCQSLEMVNKDQQVLLHKKNVELVENKLAAAEERHTREITSQRRMSEHLQDENHNLKRQLSEFQGRCLPEHSPAKRSKTD